IKSLSLKHLNTEEDNSLARIIRKREIVSQILGYFNKNRELNIEGFVRFRLKSYIQDLRYAVQKAIDDFNVEKEYNEFIDLLRYFVELQEPQRGPVNVLKKGDSFELLDEKGREIDDPHMEKCLQELTAEQNQVEFEDLLISALVNISPAEVILHFRDSEVIEVLGCIFREKIVLCEGCDLCDSE
ncbi:MAG: sporulation protein YtxC, partial [Halanaerobiales bacterium]